LSQDLHDEISSCNMRHGATGAIREPILCRLVFRDRNTDIAIEIGAEYGAFFTQPGPEASVNCLAAIRPESGVKPTCRDRSTDAVDPNPT
jgi:hypothetical protein